MTWKNDKGIYSVQPTEPHNPQKRRLEMAELEIKLQLAEKLLEQKIAM